MSQRKPTALKLIEGTWRPDRQKNEPKPKPTRPTMPGWLAPEAKREWRRLAPELERLGLLTMVDRATLAGYCQAFARWKQAEATIDAEGFTLVTEKGNVVQHPAVSIARNQAAMMRRLAAEFGLTPKSRGSIDLPPREEDPDDDNLLD